MDITTKRSMNLKSLFGISNFKKVVTEGYAYIDKTVYITKHQILLRLPSAVTQ